MNEVTLTAAPGKTTTMPQARLPNKS